MHHDRLSRSKEEKEGPSPLTRPICGVILLCERRPSQKTEKCNRHVTMDLPYTVSMTKDQRSKIGAVAIIDANGKVTMRSTWNDDEEGGDDAAHVVNDPGKGPIYGQYTVCIRSGSWKHVAFHPQFWNGAAKAAPTYLKLNK
ncbi:hypothetical protein PRIPAC_88830 [Pristionchus pacificus]|uniref:Uncharacterized protein n=1 Tax=Pristionchus pacificus TaxID=54126 RepID=A0A2A6B3K4_PRIPA|nr:hypothetical protein PRIPAC_88830 [Pristionchus pacificus]|eukprot:PDM60448.1 hypothetical protein PRIPAC_53426 [Pristionchus pacificus]